MSGFLRTQLRLALSFWGGLPWRLGRAGRLVPLVPALAHVAHEPLSRLAEQHFVGANILLTSQYFVAANVFSRQYFCLCLGLRMIIRIKDDCFLLMFVFCVYHDYY